MSFVFGVVLFALAIGVSIALHEFGHLLTAKMFGMKATEYFIGFGPRIFSFRKGETEYGLKAIPAGGYVRIIGMTALEEVDPADQKRAFYNQKVWKRVVVLSAGSVMHFIIGVLVVYLMAVSTGMPNLENKPIVGEVSQCVPAAQDTKTTKLVPCAPGDKAPALAAGLQKGDRILSVAGKATPAYADVLNTTRAASGPTPFVVDRAGQQLTLTIDVAQVRRMPLGAKAGDDRLETVGAVGLANAGTISYGAFSAVGPTFEFTGLLFQNAWEGLKKLPEKVPVVVKAIFGDDNPERPVSVVGASIMGGDAVERGLWEVFLILLAMLNLFIGVFNLLPLLPLDGGHIAVNLYEKARNSIRRMRGRPIGAPVDYTRLLPLTYVMIFLGGALMLLTITADVVNPLRLGGQ
ncbi:site-2 protease family protein [Allokutzneria sp. A3M-2-11 16]|uniref:M50 family metallopeptidase n=1 Tax=Allokutzneria sp. A3M-2-11 16 TaxID=2962043 RepID=UPI0020B7D851|nr:site-2 protease family protein [Allokutzneria sp. A3M-2-11 16]MCP3797920.1 site-2 protease family protein [Allokutzneria sp. A3M-2-11 16]